MKRSLREVQRVAPEYWGQSQIDTRSVEVRSGVNIQHAKEEIPTCAVRECFVSRSGATSWE